jgi:SAM-dependent MidA family methyltransferase
MAILADTLELHVNLTNPLPLSTASTSMPVPSPEALAHSQACAAMLRDEIKRANGWISFATFMDRALYAPGLGYYAAGARKFGAAGDFITAPEISSLFGICLANSVVDTLRETGGAILELGPGSGKLAFDILMALDAIETIDAKAAIPEKYYLLEVSADLRERQREKLATLPAHLFARCEWISALPTDFVGAIIANEVLDVVPNHLVMFGAGEIFERGVAVKDDQFIWQDVTALPSDVQKMVEIVNRDHFAHAAPEGYLTEFAPQAAALTASLVNALKAGVIMLIDYGFRRAEFYHPSRTTGTLMCHYRHHAHPDPFFYPSLQDITAHVDFTAVADAGVAAGATLIGYATQANFLLAADITSAISRFDPNDAAKYLAVTNQAQRLLSPAEMGEFFKVIGFAKGGQTIAALENARQMPL